MKKVFSIVAIAAGVALVSCGGPSAEDKAKAEQAKLDSINAAATALAAPAATDSIKPADSSATATAPAAPTEEHH
jgi:hypothetical protein